MDPNQILKNLRKAHSDYEDTVGAHAGAHIDAADDMRNAIVAMDEWLSKGGFKPTDWA